MCVVMGEEENHRDESSGRGGGGEELPHFNEPRLGPGGLDRQPDLPTRWQRNPRAAW
jgi:hypothetical protein